MPNFRTVRFGELDYRNEDVIHLPEGLVGMPQLRNWLILEMGDGGPMKWFQSLDRGDFGFPVSQAYLFHDDYEFPLSNATGTRLGNQHPDDIATLIITTIHAGGDKVTGNLLAPLVIDTETRRGVQLNLGETSYGIQQEINYFKFGLAVNSETAEDGATVKDTADAMVENGEQIPETVGV
jgi:flagellar assembly factor FliW